MNGKTCSHNAELNSHGHLDKENIIVLKFLKRGKSKSENYLKTPEIGKNEKQEVIELDINSWTTSRL